MEPNDDALRFFNRLSGRLHIELSEAPAPIAPNLANLAAPAEALITHVSMIFEVFENGDFRPLTDEEQGRVVVRAPSIRMRERRGEVMVEHRAPDGAAFTVRDLCAAVEETARRSRGDSRWFGGVDVHHVFFEGIRREGDVWSIGWGS